MPDIHPLVWLLVAVPILILLFWTYAFFRLIRIPSLLWPLVPIEPVKDSHFTETVPTDNPYAPPQSTTEDAPGRFLTMMTLEAEALGYRQIGDFHGVVLVLDKVTGEYRIEPIREIVHRFLISPNREHIAQFLTGWVGQTQAKFVAIQTLLEDGKSRQTYIARQSTVDLAELSTFQLAEEVDFSKLLDFHNTWVADSPSNVRTYSVADPLADLRDLVRRSTEICADRGYIFYETADHTIGRYTKRGALWQMVRDIQSMWSSRRIRRRSEPKLLAWMRRVGTVLWIGGGVILMMRDLLANPLLYQMGASCFLAGIVITLISSVLIGHWHVRSLR